ASVQSLGVAAADHLHHRGEVAEGPLGLAPVLGDSRGRLVDLVENAASVAGGLRARVERVLQFRSLGEVVAQQRIRWTPGTGAPARTSEARLIPSRANVKRVTRTDGDIRPHRSVCDPESSTSRSSLNYTSDYCRHRVHNNC